MMPHAVEQCFANGELHILLVIWAEVRILRAAVEAGHGKILLYLTSADAIHPKHRTSRQSTDFLIRRIRLGYAAEEIKSSPSGRFWTLGDLSAGQQRFNLGRKAKSPPIVCIV